MIRVFVVGCPRSGTTLLQCLLAAHSQLISFPESHLHYDFSKAVERLTQFDYLAQQQNLLGWVEKTPRHLHYIPDIQALCPNAKFIHCIRDAKANIAALYTIERRYGTAWSYRPKTLEACFQRWKKDYQLSQSYKNDSNHQLIKYEGLTENTAQAVNDLCHFLNLKYEPAMLEKYASIAPLVDEQAAWKASVRKPIQNFNRFDLSYLLPEELLELEELCKNLPTEFQEIGLQNSPQQEEEQ